MLRQGFMRKYRVKSKYDTERFQKEDEGYLLKLTRPIKNSSIKALSKEKLNNFIEDVLTNRKMTRILYDSNAKIEIKSTLNLLRNFRVQSDNYEKMQAKIESSVVKKRSRKEAYVQMRTEINDFADKKHRYIKNLLEKNYEKYLEMKKESQDAKYDYTNSLKQIRIDSFRRAYDKIQLKYDDNNGKTVETEYNDKSTNLSDKRAENYYIFRNNFINCKHSVHIPRIKFNIKNVYSRLYNNKVLLTSKTEKNIKKSKLLRSTKHHFHSRDKRNTLSPQNNLQQQNLNKYKFKIKNVFKANGGKEFTIKVTDEMFKKCLDKYSGGPTTIPNLKEDLTKIFQEKKIDIKGFVDFYDLVDKNTGDSYLHIASRGNYYDLAKYFLEKGCDVNKQNLEGDTALHLAASNKYMKLIKLLLDYKAKLDIPNKEGKIPFDLFTFAMKKTFGLETRLIINPTKG